jgi:hypothetical protein
MAEEEHTVVAAFPYVNPRETSDMTGSEGIVASRVDARRIPLKKIEGDFLI